MRLSFKPATPAAIARAFKVSPARQRRIRREVMEFIEKYKDSLGLSNSRGNSVKSRGRATRRTAHRSIHVRRAS